MAMFSNESKTSEIDIKSNENNSNNVSNIHKTLYCIRHAQSKYNETIRTPATWFNKEFWFNWFDPMIHDPLLSNTGKKQTDEMEYLLHKSSFITTFNIDLILTSPLQRAIHTMLNILKT
eukprot:715580_1